MTVLLSAVLTTIQRLSDIFFSLVLAACGLSWHHWSCRDVIKGKKRRGLRKCGNLQGLTPIPSYHPSFTHSKGNRARIPHAPEVLRIAEATRVTEVTKTKTLHCYCGCNKVGGRSGAWVSTGAGDLVGVVWLKMGTGIIDYLETAFAQKIHFCYILIYLMEL